MNNILDKVKIYLDKVSTSPVEISEDLLNEFGEACKSALRKQFSEKRQDKFEPRMSTLADHYANYKWRLRVSRVMGNHTITK